MSVLVYKIQHPDTIDAQVTGVGIYRTVNGGTSPLLVGRFQFPTQPAYSVTVPSDVATIADTTQLIAHTALIVPESTIQFGYKFKRNRIAYTTPADRDFIQFDGRVLELNHLITMSAEAVPPSTTNAGVYAMFRWEVEQINGVTPVAMTFAKGTQRFEGFNTSEDETGDDIATDTPFDTYRVADGGDTPVKFAHFETINTRPRDSAAAGVRDLVSAFEVTPFLEQSSTDECYATQTWERDGIAQGQYNLDDQWRNAKGAPNGEDSQGRRAIYRWEIDLYDITQTWYWAYLDQTADASLGAAVETDNDEPPAGNILSIFQEHAFLSGDPDNPHYLSWSKRFRPEAWPVANFVEIGTAADPIKAHLPITGVLGVLTVNTKYRVAGNATSGFVHDEAVSHRGTFSPRSLVATDRGAIFVARDGVFTTNFLGPDTKLSDAIDSIFLGEARNDYAKINWDYGHLIAGGFYKNRYYFSYPAHPSTTNNMTGVFSFDTNEWTFWDVGFNSFLAENDTDLFLAGGGDGFVYIIEVPTANDDNGTDIAFELQTKDFAGANVQTRNLFLYFKVDAECRDESMTAEFYVDDALIQSHTISGSRTNRLLRLPEDTHGYKWRVRVTYTGDRRVAVYGVTAIYIPLRAA